MSFVLLRLGNDVGEIHECFLIHAKHILSLKYNKEKEEEKGVFFKRPFRTMKDNFVHHV